MDAFTPDWSELPKELLSQIASRLPLLSDYLRFTIVCKPWAAARRAARPPLERPWMLPFNQPHHALDGHLVFLPLANRRPLRLYVPELFHRWICGASRGWFITVDRQLHMHLVHPFAHTQIPLPVPPSLGMERLYAAQCLRGRSLLKAVLSADPVVDPTGCIIMAINGATGKLTFCRPGDARWTVINDPYGIYSDLIHYNGRFYAAPADPAVVVCDLASPVPRTSICVSTGGRSGYPNYLVEVDGDLLFVARLRCIALIEYGEQICRTFKIEVFKLDNETGTWVETKDLGKMALLLTPDQAVPILEEEFPGCKKNFIYFTDLHYNNHAMCKFEEAGMFDLENGMLHPFTQKELFSPLYEPSIFMTPVLYPGGEARSPETVAGPSQTQDASA
ncbi:F-box protein At2g26160-like [Phoenix dactylifera]|uniref:F-box protein At2g26160-like n=1 Tax=Phoenix dactylifera TaxID=42345 RepID=A0A8B7D037_PHODC|nr:F-box protein At2g26160-like [Phoenix dactylifera]